MSEETAIAETVRVYVRPRPLSVGTALDCTPAFSTAGIQSVSNDSKSCVYINQRNHITQQFFVDRIFDEYCSQQEVFQNTVEPLITSVCDGYRACVLAYGPTGSGKTFTMRGTEQTEGFGMIPRTVLSLLEKRAGYAQREGRFEIWASYFEIYCEVLTDLLAEAPTDPYSENAKLIIRNTFDGLGVYVENLSKYAIESVEDLMALLQRGDQMRMTAATNMNEASSRSHAILVLSVISSVDASAQMVKEGKLVLVDLAGSERAKASEGRGYQRQEEAKAINLSLSALGNCIAALAEGRSHIPYRDSKLTRVLQDCLCGVSRTSIIVTLTRGEDSTGEALNALRFASRARRIKVLAKMSKHQNYEELYQDVLKKLRLLEDASHNQVQSKRDGSAELEELRLQLQQKDELLQQQAAEMAIYVQELDRLRVNKVERVVDGGIAADNAINSAVTTMQEGQNEVVHRLEKISKQYQQQLQILRKKNEELHREHDEALSQLREARTAHLQTMQELRSLQEKHTHQLQHLQSRLNESLEELEVLRNKYEDSLQQLLPCKDENALLRQQIEELERRLAEMVSRSQVEEMERLFAETVQRLSDRVQLLEKSGKTSAPPLPQPQAASALHSHSVPALSRNQKAGSATSLANEDSALVVRRGMPAVTGDRVVRMEPGGRIRAPSMLLKPP